MIEELRGTRETVHFEDGCIAKLHDNDEAESYPMHWHLPVEIIMPVTNHYGIGCGKTLYDLREEDILFVQPGVLHECIAPDHGRRFFCQVSLPAPLISPKSHSEMSLILPPVMLITPEVDAELHANLRQLLYQTYQEDSSSSMLKNFTKYLYILQLIHLAYGFFEKSPAQSAVDKTARLETITQMQHACAHIMEHYAEDITLDSVSRSVGFSKYHFTRLFRSHTGETFYHYVNTVRMSNAQVLLSDPGNSITDIAYSVGYSSMSSFIRMFKGFYGCTPSEYRRMLEAK